MNILLIHPGDLAVDQFNGLGIYTLQIVESLLKDKNNSVSIVCLHKDHGKGTLPSTHIDIISKIIYISSKEPQTFARIRSIFSQNPSAHFEFNKKIVFKRLSEIIRQYKPTVIALNHRRCLWVLDYLRSQYSDSLIYIAHNAEGKSMMGTAGIIKNIFMKNAIKWEADKIRKEERRSVKAVKRVIAISDEDASNLAQSIEMDKIRVIPAYCRVPSRPVDLSNRTKSFLLVGSFSWRPKYENALWLANVVFPIIKKSAPDSRLMIVGSNANTLIPQILDLSGIEIYDGVPDTGAFFSQNVIFLNPERQPGGLKIKSIEAAAFGLPIVSFEAGISGTFLIHKTSVLVASNYKDFSIAAISLLTEDRLRQSLGNAAHEVCKRHFSQCIVERKWLSAFSNVEDS